MPLSILMLLFFVGNAPADDLFAPEAYPRDSEGDLVDDEPAEPYFYEGFENFADRIDPWPGSSGFLWKVYSNQPAAGEKALQINPFRWHLASWVISPEFSIPDRVRNVVAEAYIGIQGDEVTYQFVPQGDGFVLARLIIYPDGQAAIFDAGTGDEPLRLPFFFEQQFLQPHVKCTFVLDRSKKRYKLYFDDVLYHTGPSFTATLEDLVFVCHMEFSGSRMVIDEVSVRPLAQNVPTLQSWALIALITSMLACAIWLLRRNRLLSQLCTSSYTPFIF